MSATTDRRNALPDRELTFDESRRRIAEASKYLAGGVSSNFRLGISPTPLVLERGEGACLIDVDGNRLIDYYLSMGPMILGHNPADVIAAVKAVPLITRMRTRRTLIPDSAAAFGLPPTA